MIGSRNRVSSFPCIVCTLYLHSIVRTAYAGDKSPIHDFPVEFMLSRGESER